eukprot:CAMPEP_0118952278 /NCGR_PEP_ID=MMETSP1169-20130426/54570_1 /TAXON_ID=36882 /ORGANISM="Pyramimonas obovata, Strain CCMP722" /LENGTH=304 /DNA_ID=CAMNT_0006899487 /DNA_START=180 /DNA_END=1091 /DNA_ORIENTATION=-
MNAEMSKLIEETVKKTGGTVAALQAFEQRDSAEHRGSDGKVAVPDVIPGSLKTGTFEWDAFLCYAGPGLLICSAYIDPGNIEAALATGNFFGTHLVWIMVWSIVPTVLMQSMAVRVTVATSTTLAELLRCEYESPAMQYLLFGAAELSVLAFLVPQVYGVAFALYELLDVPMWLGAGLAGFGPIAILSLRARHTRRLEAIFGYCLGVVLVCCAGNAFLAVTSLPDPLFDLVDLVEGALLPSLGSLSSGSFVLLSVLAASVAPHNLYLHSRLALTRYLGPSAECAATALQYHTADATVAAAAAAA